MSIFVTTINLSLAEKLKSDLSEQGFELSTPPYTVFCAKKKGVSCTLYQSGKLTVQGKERDAFIKFYLEPEVLGDLSYSYPEVSADLTPRIGIDESGKGDFFGPLCIAGVQADAAKIKELLAMGVRDSKQLGDQAIIALSKKIRLSFPHSIVVIFPLKYNSLYEGFQNLNQLLAWGHATAISELVEKTACTQVIIDQFASEHVVINALKRKQITVDLKQMHRAEADPVVAAASILARAAFLEGLEKLGQQYSVILPKGAAAIVIKAGKFLVAKYGKEVLRSVAKLHFKTTGVVLDAQASDS
jgi:ribonuclease HIII